MREKSGIKQKTRKILLILISALLIPAILCACGCKHEWYKATCTEPKTCDKCGETEGEPLGHDWQEATCTEPKTCKMCGETEGEPMGHTPGDWEMDEDSKNMITATATSRRFCQVCGEELESEAQSFVLNDGDRFLFTVEEFSQRLNTFLVNSNSYFTSYAEMYRGEMSCFLVNAFDGQLFAATSFSNKAGGIMSDFVDGADVKSFTVNFYSNDMSEIEPVMRSIIKTCDNSISTTETEELMQQITQLNKENDTYENNDIWYSFVSLKEIEGYEDYDYYLFIVSLGEF